MTLRPSPSLYILAVLIGASALFFISLTENTLAQSGARCNTYNEGDTPPAGYGAAWDVLSSARMHMLHSYCHNDGSHNFTVGHPDAPDTWYVYKQGYYFSSSWKPFTLNGEFAEGSTDWLLREGYLSLATPPQRPFYWVGYVCSWTGSEWKCGCRDQACTQNYWQLQQATASGGGGSVGTIDSPVEGDDTFSCLNSFSGPVVNLDGDQGFTSLVRNQWSSETRFDARTAKWSSFLRSIDKGGKNCQPVRIGADWVGCAPDRFDLYNDAANLPPPGPPACFAGGIFIGTQPRNLTWGNVKSAGAATLSINSDRAIIDGIRVDNSEDPVLPMTSRHFEFKNSWITYNRDDCVENDAFAKGLVDDNLFDGCFVFYSGINDTVPNPPVAPGGGTKGVVEIRNNLIRMQNMPGPAGGHDSSKSGYGHAIKTWEDFNANPLTLHNNIFLFEGGGVTGKPDIKMFGSELRSCSNNIIVWAGSGSYSGSYPKNCFTVTKDMSVWTKAKQNWINCHPLVPRISGDPQSNPNSCQANAYGGGQGGTQIPN